MNLLSFIILLGVFYAALCRRHFSFANACGQYLIEIFTMFRIIQILTVHILKIPTPYVCSRQSQMYFERVRILKPT
jgi:hypothetical protein